MDFSSGLSSFGTDSQSYSSGPADGNYSGGGAGAPNPNHGAFWVAALVLAAIALLVFGVISLRASGEVVI